MAEENQPISIPARDVVRPRPLTWKGAAAAYAIYSTVRCLAASVRFELDEVSAALLEPPRIQVIFCAWHNRLALSVPLYDRYWGRKHERRLAAMVSASKDGSVLARVLELLGAQPVRGSSSRRGPQALLELTTWAKRGFDLAITPDGPRGPRYKVQEGVIALAQLAELPILPISYSITPKVVLKSWDRFQIPLPLARCTVRVGEMLRVARRASDAVREECRVELERRMLAITVDSAGQGASQPAAGSPTNASSPHES